MSHQKAASMPTAKEIADIVQSHWADWCLQETAVDISRVKEVASEASPSDAQAWIRRVSEDISARIQAALPFNGLSPAELERLALLVEEMGETQQAIGKIMRHGYESRHPDGGPTNRMSLENELGDVAFAGSMLRDNGDIVASRVNEAQDRKSEKISQYLHHQLDGSSGGRSE